MLILKRRVDEQVFLRTSDGLIRITVAGMKGDKTVNIGVDAPSTVKVLRGELVDEEEREEYPNRRKCVPCEGTGRMLFFVSHSDGHREVMEENCRYCNGKGTIGG